MHLVAWLLVLEALGLAMFVIARPLFRDLPDAGVGASKLLALALLTFGMFVWSAWLGRPAGRSIAVSLLVVLLLAGIYVGWRTWAGLVAIWRDRRGVLIAAELTGVGMFAIATLLRAANPDLWHPDRGGEKPFELALLTTVLRSRTFPVYDPWFAGGVLNYHFGGWYLLSVPARALRTPPPVMMNIGVGVIASCTAGALFSLGAAAIDGPPRRRRASLCRTGPWWLRASSRRSARSCSSSVAVLRPLRLAVTGSGLPVDWWGLSRVVPDSVVITEFPGWSLLFGDLHPHLMGIGVLALTATICVALHAALVAGSGRRWLGLAALVGMMLGFVA